MEVNFSTKENMRGFTLVETLVAIAILSLSILAAFTAVQAGLQNSGIAKDRITAFFLTQEAMEIFKNIRDQRNIANLSSPGSTFWLRNISENASDPCYFGKTCTLDANMGIPAGISTCSGAFGTCPNLKQDTTTKLYGYTAGWPNAIFKREIQFAQNSAEEVVVTIRMSWTTRGTNKSFQISQLLFNRE